jgi:hypothetical protein
MSYSITVPDQEYFDKNIPCRAACPIHTECGRYVQAIGISRDEEAYLLARAPNLHYARRVSGGSWPDSHVILAGVSLPKVRL